jgi:superfamily II DNA/RNA helicase
MSQTLLFSATLHDPIIQQLSQAIQRFPTWVDLKGTFEVTRCTDSECSDAEMLNCWSREGRRS